MQTGENGGADPNYRPNSFDDIVADESYKEPSMQLDQITEQSNVADWYDRNENDDDHFTQPGLLYRNAMNEQDRIHLISNIVSSMKGISGDKKEEISNRQLCHFFRADSQLGMAVAKGLGIVIDEKAIIHTK